MAPASSTGQSHAGVTSAAAWGAALPEEVPLRLQTQLQAALQIAAQLDDQPMQAALDRIQLRTQDQLRQMDRLRLHAAAQVLTQVREMAQLGQSDPQQFRARVGTGRPVDVPPQPQMTPRADPSRTPQPSRPPQHTPQATGMPQNHSYGPRSAEYSTACCHAGWSRRRS